MTRFSTRPQTLQRVDRFAGAPLCFVLTCLRRILDLLRRPDAKAAPRRILFVKLIEQGSTVLAHQAIRAAVARVGRENVYFLVFEENRFILDLLGLIPPANVFPVRAHTAWSAFTTGVAHLRTIRRLRIDTCVDLEGFIRSAAAICYLSGAHKRVGLHGYFDEGPYRGDLFTHRVLYNAHLHTAQVFSVMVRAIDVDPDTLPVLPFVPEPPAPPPTIQFPPAELADVRRILDELGVPTGARLVLLNSNASDLLPIRKWDGANYADLARRLLTRFPDLHVAFTGSPDEAPVIAELVRSLDSPRAVCVAGRTTLRQLVTLYHFADVLVTNDSGPAHFASLTRTDVVVLFGPETPLLFGAPGPRTHIVSAGIACSPCISPYNNRQTTCRDNVCMKSITVDQVFALTCRVLEERSIRPA